MTRSVRKEHNYLGLLCRGRWNPKQWSFASKLRSRVGWASFRSSTLWPGPRTKARYGTLSSVWCQCKLALKRSLDISNLIFRARWSLIYRRWGKWNTQVWSLAQSCSQWIRLYLSIFYIRRVSILRRLAREVGGGHCKYWNDCDFGCTFCGYSRVAEWPPSRCRTNGDRVKWRAIRRHRQQLGAMILQWFCWSSGWFRF